MKRFTVALLLATQLAGCMGSTAPVPPDNFYRFRVAAPDQRTPRASLPGVLSITAFDGDGLVRSRPVIFTNDDDAHTVRQHNYHYWADSPTRMLQLELVTYLRRRGTAGAVVTPQMRVRADYELIGSVKRLERILGDGPSRVAVELDFAVIRQTDRRLIVEQSYSVEIKARDDSVDASIAALSEAVSKIFDNLAGDIDRSGASSRG